MDFQLDPLSLVLVLAAAAIAPLVSDFSGRLFVPTVVVEVFLGILIGPQVLDIAKVDPSVDFLGDLGLAFLFFLAGLEIEIGLIRGRPLRLATAGWLGSLALGFAAAGALSSFGLFGGGAVTVVAIALATTAMGTLMPILRDQGVLGSPFGNAVVGSGVAGEFWPIVVMSIFLTGTRGTGTSVALLAVFFALAVLGAVTAGRVHPPRIVRVVQQTLHASGQLGVRLAILLLASLLYISVEFGLDYILGAFAAGLLTGLVARGPGAPTEIREKLEAIGFGFFVPIFFIRSGMLFDLDSLLHDPVALATVPLFLGLFLVARGSTAFLFRSDLSGRQLLPLGLFTATALPLVVALTEIGVEEGHLTRDDGAALVGAAMLSVLLFPLFALRKLGREPTEPDAGEW